MNRLEVVRRLWPVVLAACILSASPLAAQAPGSEALPEVAAEQPVKVIKMYAENWKWRPRVIRVTQGTRLKITVENIDAPHRFDLKAYKLKVRLPEDKTTKFEFVADRVGTFAWRCGRPCGDGCAKMRGKLIVE